MFYELERKMRKVNSNTLQVYPSMDSVTAQKDVIASLCLQQGGGYYGEA